MVETCEGTFSNPNLAPGSGASQRNPLMSLSSRICGDSLSVVGFLKRVENQFDYFHKTSALNKTCGFM